MSLVSPNYKINNNSLPSPTDIKWVIPDVTGVDGSGQSRYDPFYSFEFSWSFLTQAQYNNLYRIWLGAYGSGTSTFQVPTYDTQTYGFSLYSGVQIDMPVFGNYDNNMVQQVKMTVRKIRV